MKNWFKKFVLTTRTGSMHKLLDSYIFAVAGLEAAYFAQKGYELLDGKHAVINWATVGYTAIVAIAPPILRILDARFPVLTKFSNKLIVLLSGKAGVPPTTV